MYLCHRISKMNPFLQLDVKECINKCFHSERTIITMANQDPIDSKILKILKNDSRLSHKDIGELVHRTGQAVGNRIAKMQNEGLIQKYTVELEYEATQFIRIMMENHQFDQFEIFLSQFDKIEYAYKVCGSACYMLISHFTQQDMNDFIEKLSPWGQYSVDSVVRAIELQP